MNNKSSDKELYSGMISLEEIIELAKKKDAGDYKAREKLILSHLWCVDKFVSYYISKISHLIDKEELYKDLYQEGCYGLILAVDKYDWRKGFYLTTYAQDYIRKYVMKHISSRIGYIRLPEKIFYAGYKYNIFLIEFMAEHNRRPTVEECAEGLNVTVGTIKSILRYAALFHVRQDGEDIFVSFDDDLSADYSKGAEEIIQETLQLELNDLEVKLNDRERAVIEGYFGLDGKGARRFKQIGEELGISDEIARRAYHSGIEKLRKAFGVYTEK